MPEVGERVLVEFLGQWDSEAVVIGAVRHGGVSPADSARDTKRWRTPSGNEVALTTEGEGAGALDVVSVRVRSHVALEAKIGPGGESVAVQCGPNYVHLTSQGGSARVEVVSGGALLVHAAGHLQIEGDSVQIKAKGGAVAVSDRVRGGGGGAGQKALATAPATKKKAKPPAARPGGGAGGSATAGKQAGKGGKGGKRYVVYRDANGNVREVRTGGTVAWRNNNPGNMMYDGVAQKYGAVGISDVHKFAIFPDDQSGMDAISGKLQSPSYQYKPDGSPMTIHDAIFRWAPPSDHNDSPAYVQAIRDQTHLDPEQEVRSLSASDLRSVASAIRGHEGNKAGTTYTPDSPNAPAWVQGLMGH